MNTNWTRTTSVTVSVSYPGALYDAEIVSMTRYALLGTSTWFSCLALVDSFRLSLHSFSISRYRPKGHVLENKKLLRELADRDVLRPVHGHQISVGYRRSCCMEIWLSRGL